MDEREALVAAIAANPDDDTPRLAFADWLQEHGEDDRAEFIRLECERARLTEDDPRCHEIITHVKGLFTKHMDSWIAPLCRVLDVEPTPPRPRAKGFLARALRTLRGQPREVAYCAKDEDPRWRLCYVSGWESVIAYQSMGEPLFRQRFSRPELAQIDHSVSDP
jgi:uncharacterized protein (TIGR02996 family)